MLSRLYMKLFPPSLETHLRNVDRMLARGCSAEQLLHYMREWGLGFDDSVLYCEHAKRGDSVALSICRHDRVDLMDKFYQEGLLTLREKTYIGSELYLYCTMMPSAPQCFAYIVHANHAPGVDIEHPLAIEAAAEQYAHDFPDAHREYLRALEALRLKTPSREEPEVARLIASCAPPTIAAAAQKEITPLLDELTLTGVHARQTQRIP